ncbi:tRNA (N(6)-L-threonylcarbamoyladenosine(37)-C(2))-methylthiotransferase MtaB [Blattabacterium cuenoti]|uniref:MiaB family tRNA modification enzyme: 2-methylthioadenine synthetase n=1 Tax=Blattabacterium cuenoti STAT TaxID=1457030 RepID=A0A224ABH8_9FLAO|nr:tRNA (N(6)-L-threonylcarbamoyladenosine(37)-C(2))-methylthiotransferase MtaB [Blattabacterium cuenoti]BBA17226.1 MiaB family tRNA modification enzyme: 2-methylthioadenine synthetase [Blattabacterium cuenoti STAT]
MVRKKVAFYTMGCKLNYAETSTIARKFSILDYQQVPFKSYADIYVINSCSVTKNAEIEFQHIVRSTMKINSKAFIVAIGCYAQFNPKKVSSITGIDLVLGYEEKFKIVDYLNRGLFLKQKYYAKIISKKTYFSSFSVGDRTRSFLKIQDGCDYKCSYCIIPMSRGPSRSESIKNILKNIRFLFTKGVKEIVLTGVNIGDYGEKNIYGKNLRFFDLIEAIDQIQEKVRIRLSSIEPNLLQNECIDFLSKSKHFVPHFHIPLQSGSNKILMKMHRRYRRELYQEKVKKIRSLMPYAYIGSDIIVGFPGEKHKHFLETYHFLKKLEISSLHIFSYSTRPNTKSSMMIQENISKKIQWKRNQILRGLSNKKYRFFCQKQINTKKTVLFEKNSGNHKKYLYGYTENYIRTKIPLNSSSIFYENTLQDVLITKVDDKDGIMIAEPINN